MTTALLGRPGMFFALQPPHLPDDLADLKRATKLMGHMIQGRVKHKTLREIERLLGGLPHPDIAVDWKMALRRHRKELMARKAGCIPSSAMRGGL